MADNLEESGIKLVADGVGKYTADMDKVAKSNEAAVRSIEKLGSNTGGAGLDKIASGASSASAAVAGLGGAGSSAGSALAAGMSVAGGAITGLIALAGAAVAAIGLIGNAVNAAVQRGRSLQNIQDATGADVGTAGRIFSGAREAGLPIGTVTGAMQSLNAQLDATANKADKAFGAMGVAADKANTRLSRLNADYAQSVNDITTTAAQRIQENNDRLVESHVAMLQRQARADEDYSRELGQGRAALSQRIQDIETSTAASIASLTQRQARASDDYNRETEAARQDLAQRVIDITSGLNDRLAQLQQNAADQNVSALDRGAATQSKIQEDLQKQLYDIEQKYTSKRQSLQEKIFDPSTNPILRAYYKTQLGSLTNLQRAEEQGARAGASAKAEQARRETEAVLAETASRLARETALEQAQAQQAVARQQQEATQRQAERLREYSQQQADLTAQIAVENQQRAQQIERARADQATRETDLQRSYERQNADAQASYDKQVQDATVAQAKIQAETEKRLAAEKQQFDRSIEDINTSLANAGGGASAAVAQITPLQALLNKLGISAEEFKKKPIGEQLKLIGDEANRLIAQGDLAGARDLMTSIFGPAVGGQMLRFLQKFQDTKGLGIDADQLDKLIKFSEGVDGINGQLDDLVVDIGIAFLPLFQTLLSEFQDFWKQHGPEVVQAIKNIGHWVVTDAVPAVINITDKVVKFVEGFIKAAKDVDEKCRAIFKSISQLGIDIHNTAVAIHNGITDFVLAIFDDFKTKIDNVINFIGFLKSKFDEFVRFLGTIQLPSWLQPNGSGLTASVNYPSSNSSGFRSQSIPATGAQMAASNVTNSKSSTNSGNNITIHNSFNGKTETSTVRDGVAQGLFKAGFAITK